MTSDQETNLWCQKYLQGDCVSSWMWHKLNNPTIISLTKSSIFNLSISKWIHDFLRYPTYNLWFLWLLSIPKCKWNSSTKTISEITLTLNKPRFFYIYFFFKYDIHSKCWKWDEREFYLQIGDSTGFAPPWSFWLHHDVSKFVFGSGICAILWTEYWESTCKRNIFKFLKFVTSKYLLKSFVLAVFILI